VARELLDRGHQCTVYDNLSSGLRENLFPEEGFIHGDILDYPALRDAMAGETIIQTSWNVYRRHHP